MKTQNPIHIRLSNSEATNIKRDMLSSQMSSIRVAKTIKNFNELRQQELKIKTNLQKKVKEFKADIKKLEQLLPKANLPKILQKHEADKDIGEKIIRQIPINDVNLDEQLQEIQNRLNSL
ncbi:hypothetical protein KAR91_27975 [Candidatus Pacearchaeota archaeon]|nr:hypothetical protein [Candidatus Pacearchaeota archaeon]